MNDLIAGVRHFRHAVFPAHRALFEALAHGQHPEVLFITCSDSRIDPELLTQSPPGRMFVLRNAGNLVPPSQAPPGGEAATLHYAVETLKVHHVVVCGHSGCGAMQALLSDMELPELLLAWLRHAEAVRHEAQGDVERAVESNVRHQLANLRSHDFVAQAEASGRLQLHGWVYDIPRGHVRALDAHGRFRALDEVNEEEALVQELGGDAATAEEGWVDHGPWRVVLVDPGDDMDAAVMAVSQVLGVELRVAEERVRQTPCELMHGVSREEAELVGAWLEDAGARVAVASR